MKTKFILMSLALLLLGPLNAFSQTIHSISIKNMTFENAEIIIDKGDKIIWTNNDGMAHSVTQGTNCVKNGFDSGSLNAGASFEYTFTSAGTFDYFCQLHCSMVGKVTVNETATNILATNVVVSTVKTYPNPFVTDTDVQVQLGHGGKVKLEVYDMYGHKLMALQEVKVHSGEQVFKISGESLRDGIFVCKIYFNGKPVASEYIVKKSKPE